VYANARLAERFDAGLSGEHGLVGPGRAVAVFVRAIGGVAGGREPLFLVFAALAVIGTVVLWRRERAFVALAVLAFASLPALLIVTRGSQDFSDHLSSRQFIFVFPLWIGLVSVGYARAVNRFRPYAQALALIALAALALLAPQVVPDPRTAPSGRREALAAPADWMRDSAPAHAVLFPASPVFLASLSATRHGHAIPREQPSIVSRAIRRASLPTPSVFVAVPLEDTRVDRKRLRASLGAGYRVLVYEYWLLVEARGPFAEESRVLATIARILDASGASIAPHTVRLTGYLHQGRAAVCGALWSFGGRCPTIG
jgi:hypothetical protein